MSVWGTNGTYSREERWAMERVMKDALQERGLIFRCFSTIGPSDPLTSLSFSTTSGKNGCVHISWCEADKIDGFREKVAQQLDHWLHVRERWRRNGPEELWSGGDSPDICCCRCCFENGYL